MRSVIIDAPIETVFGFHERPDALLCLTPFGRIIRQSGGLETGARVEFRVGPLRWTARHAEYEPNQYFVDEQIAGPFAVWVHHHEFEDLGDTTRLTDRVEYELRGGPVVNQWFGWLSNLGLALLFRHRHRVMRKFCETA